MCPSRIAGPAVPGSGEPVYQPALESGSSSGGTWTVLSGFRPRSITAESTPIAGMRSDTGGAGAITGPVTAGDPGGTPAGPAAAVGGAGAWPVPAG